MQTVIQFLQTNRKVWSVTPGSSVEEAMLLMTDNNIGALPVIEAGKLVGIFAERDLVRKVILKGKSLSDTLIRDVMTTPVIYVRPNTTTEECMALMASKNIRHLPVLEEDKVIGVLSIKDVLKTVVTEQEFIIQQLEDYITVGT